MTTIWVSSDNSVKKKILRKGEPSRKATERSICYIRIDDVTIAVLSIQDLKQLNCQILDGAQCPRDKVIVIGEACNKVDECMERAVQMMSIGERSLITITLPPNDIRLQEATIEVDVTLVRLEPYKPIWEWTPEEKYAVASKYKETGTELFKGSRFVDAFYKFSRACKILITLEPIEDLQLKEASRNDIDDLRVVLYNNMASCHLNRENYEHAIALASKVLDRDKDNVKALYRRAVARGRLKDFERAAVDMTNAIKLDPTNSLARKYLAAYKNELYEANRRYESMVRRMFET